MLPYYSWDSKEYQHIRYRLNKDKVKANAKRWKLNNPEKVKQFWSKHNHDPSSVEYRQNYYLKNKELFKNKNILYRQNNKERLKEKRRSFYLKNKDKLIPKFKKYYQFWKTYNRYNTIFHYTNGLMCCADCGQDIFELLTIDHINGGGGKHRKEIGSRNFYVWLRKNNFPQGYQVLCYNCNMVKVRVTPERYQEIIQKLRLGTFIIKESMEKKS